MWLFATSQRIGVWGNLGNGEGTCGIWKKYTPNKHTPWKIGDPKVNVSMPSLTIHFQVRAVSFGEFGLRTGRFFQILNETRWILDVKHRSRFGSGWVWSYMKYVNQDWNTKNTEEKHASQDLLREVVQRGANFWFDNNSLGLCFFLKGTRNVFYVSLRNLPSRKLT